jgi:hypothetical protein
LLNEGGGEARGSTAPASVVESITQIAKGVFTVSILMCPLWRRSSELSRNASQRRRRVVECVRGPHAILHDRLCGQAIPSLQQYRLRAFGPRQRAGAQRRDDPLRSLTVAPCLRFVRPRAVFVSIDACTLRRQILMLPANLEGRLEDKGRSVAWLIFDVYLATEDGSAPRSPEKSQ